MEIRENNFNVPELKRQLRKEKLALRDTLNAEDYKYFNQQILERTLSNSIYKNSDYILCYASYKSEVSTYELIKKALVDGKKVSIPKVDGIDMDFFEINSLEQLVKGYKGIPEPENDRINVAYKFHIEQVADSNVLMILPGAVFDNYKNRIGYGKGFYDRYLAKNDCNHRITTIAYAYEMQVIDYIMVEKTDQKIDFILTEKRFF